MSTSEAVTGAIALLRRRLDELVELEGRIAVEKREIEGALTSLGVAVSDAQLLAAKPHPVRESDPAPVVDPALVEPAIEAADDNERPTSVRAIVQRQFERVASTFSNDELVDAVKAIRDDLTDEQIRKNVRSALWLLRKQKTVTSIDGKNIATKWLPNAEGASGATDAPSVPVPTGTGQGGGANDGESDDHDLSGRVNHDHHRASIT